MAITLGPRSRASMVGLNPKLIRVIEHAAATATPALDFAVIEGVRTREQMMVNYGKGRTVAQLAAKGIPAKYAKPKEAKVTWLNDPFNSNHRVMADGTSHAFDAVPFPVDWNNKARFKAMAEHFLASAKVVGVRIRWGKDWDMDGRYEEKGETDGPHFELV